ncbi:hypothetical protein [Saccharicrinis fermentans]|uniref:Uncharacterized protein n=1 Tax=Saccharicrinis fermentans DSM 9555 = JCM 21142 TaxID=869213 RepID=W7YI44_9BACT|nr:hypothetical protein [Saccharicrinis fermentans]GAF02219.1 hypothetical protein JCM21142_3848 [Saccharicrinis fermentans DSM 9555 = JCM 21142]
MINFTSRVLLAVLLLSAIARNTQAQSCADVLKLCPPVDELYNKKAMARTYKMNPTQKLKIIHVFYGSTAYHINICKYDSLGDFRLKVLDYENGNVFWDNGDDNFTDEINISFGSTKRVILEITAENPEKFHEQRSCIGLVINYHREERKDEIPEPSNPIGL